MKSAVYLTNYRNQLFDSDLKRRSVHIQHKASAFAIEGMSDDFLFLTLGFPPREWSACDLFYCFTQQFFARVSQRVNVWIIIFIMNVGTEAVAIV